MFFKREKPHILTFEKQLERLASLGYRIGSSPRGTLASKGNLAAVLREDSGGQAGISAIGIDAGGELAVLTDLGFQKIFLTPSGRKLAAVAEHLQALHAFDEDLRRALGLESLYNQGLGTTNELHLYDRIEDRDRGRPPAPWQRNRSTPER